MIWDDLAEDSAGDAILERIDAVWPKLGALGPAELDGQTWCPRELMAHLSHWNEAHWFAISEHLAGRSVDIYSGWRDKNDQWFGDDREIEAPEAAGRLQASHERLWGLVGSLTAAQWDDSVRAWVLQCPVRHYREHLRSLA